MKRLSDAIRGATPQQFIRSFAALFWVAIAMVGQLEWLAVVISFGMLVGVPFVLKQRTDSLRWHASCAVMAVAAVMALFVEPGRNATLLASCWMLWTTAFAVRESRSALIALRNGDCSWITVCSAFHAVSAGFLCVGAFYHCAVRAGWSPFGFPIGISFLTVAHFQFGGFLLPSAALFLSRQLPSRLLRVAIVSMQLAFPLVAIGMLCWPALELLGVAWLLLAVEAFVVSQLVGVWNRSSSRYPQRLMALIAFLSANAGAGLAAIYAWGEFQNTVLIQIPQMIVWHGSLNAFGLVGASLVIAGASVETPSEAQSARHR